MFRVVSFALVLLATRGAAAQDGTGERAHWVHLDYADEHERQARIEIARSSPKAGRAVGWGTFGGELGFFSGTALTALAIVASLPDEGEPPDATGPALGLAATVGTVGLTIGGAALFSNLAVDGEWNLHQGWGAAGIFPGIMEGIAIAGAFANLGGADISLGERLGALLVGVVAGGATGYVTFREMSRARGSASWETLAFWCGFFTAEVAAIVALSDSTMPLGDQNATLLFTTAAGGVIAPAIIHFLLR